ncbi:MAG: hypothetical protein ABSF44_04070 [Candidatus Bathyarchaeia archaeon]
MEVKARFGPDTQESQSVWAKKPPHLANVDPTKRFPIEGIYFPF